jgi:RHS repeat-associated protein
LSRNKEKNKQKQKTNNSFQMKKLLPLLFIIQFVPIIASAQSTNYNYVKSITYLEADQSKKITAVSYSDALGRPVQDVVVGASPSGNDIVQPYEYDALGRRVKSYLPFTNTSNGTGQIVPGAVDAQTQFYDGYQGQNAFSEVQYDGSPLNRVLKQADAGNDINSVDVSTATFEPAGNDVVLWQISGNNLHRAGNYAAGSLLKYTATGPNSKKVQIWKNKSGQVLMKAEDPDGINARTVIVYDEFGLPRYVLSPIAADLMTGNDYTPTADLVLKYCYYYEYNTQHRLSKKQIPGQDYVQYWYDAKERLRLTQDGEQRKTNKRSYINYDFFGRVRSTGIGIVGDPLNLPEEITTTTNGVSDIISYTFYDNYLFVGGTDYNFDTNSAFDSKSDAVKGMTTGTAVRKMTDDGTLVYLTTVMYYDRYGRVLQTITNNHLGGFDITNLKYNFAGQVLESKQKQTIPAQSDKFLIYLYSYDPQGRLKYTSLSQNENASSPVILSHLTYNDLGEVSKKQLHSDNGGANYLQDVDYTFDIKGRMTDINNIANMGTDLFGMKLEYNADNNIHFQRWKTSRITQAQSYEYGYDGLNRLTWASYQPGYEYDETAQYDKNGNITALTRRGQILSKSKIINNNPPVTQITYGSVDNLTYTYSGNQITAVSDSVQGINTLLNNDFRGTNSAGTQYTYDLNGNMLTDANKGITVTYNALNLPLVVAKDANNRTKYLYDAAGRKLRTQVYESGLLKTTTDYCGALVYENLQIQYIQTAEGRIAYFYNNAAQITKTVTPPIVTARFEYFLTDHLGNTRVVFTKGATGAAETVQEDHYYPFGLQLSGQGYTNTTLLNKYLFNGKEKQDQTGMYDYGFRQLDPVLGRWFCVDRMAEKHPGESPYSYAGNDPVNQIDVMGLNRTGTYADGEWTWTGERGTDFSNFNGGSRVQGGGCGDGAPGGGSSGWWNSHVYQDGSILPVGVQGSHDPTFWDWVASNTTTVLSGGGSLYLFSKDGKYTGEKIPFCGNAASVNGVLVFFADPVNDAIKIDNAKKGSISIQSVTNEEIYNILLASGVFDSENQDNKFWFAISEGGAAFAQQLVDKFGLNREVSWKQKMDYIESAHLNGEQLQENTFYLNGMFAQNYQNFGNFLWGAGMNALGFSETFARLGAEIHNFFSPIYSERFTLDSSDDQFSIQLGFGWRH